MNMWIVFCCWSGLMLMVLTFGPVGEHRNAALLVGFVGWCLYLAAYLAAYLLSM